LKYIAKCGVYAGIVAFITANHSVVINLFGISGVRITMIQSQENDPFVKKYFELQEEHKQEVIKLFERDKQSGLIREDVDAAAVIDMVYLLSKETFFTIGSDGNAYQKRMETFLRIIREGIRRS
jgi:hypothetical protein